jgi:hypothetical protein
VAGAVLEVVGCVTEDAGVDFVLLAVLGGDLGADVDVVLEHFLVGGVAGDAGALADLFHLAVVHLFLVAVVQDQVISHLLLLVHELVARGAGLALVLL